MKISISALSVAYGLSSEALRYYEEKGLLSPERTSSSGFRKFSLADMQRVGIIKSMQRQGFSLDEIKHILTSCSLTGLISIMDEKRRENQTQITLALCIQSRMTTATDLLRDADRLLMQPRLCGGCAAYLAHYESVTAFWQNVPHSPHLRELIEALPLTSYCTVVPLARFGDDSIPLRTGICAPVEYSTAVRADFSRMSMSAGPRCVRVLFELVPPESRSIQPVLACAQAFIREQGLTPVSDGYTRQYAWYVDEQKRQHQYSELIIPVM